MADITIKEIAGGIATLITVSMAALAKFKFNKSRKNLKDNDLMRHPFFSRMEFLKYHGLKNIDTGDIKKDDLIRKFLKIKFDTFIGGYTNDIQNDKRGYHEEDRIGFILNLVSIYEERAKIENIPELYIKKFRKWDGNYLTTFIDRIEDIWLSEFLNTYIEKKAAEMDMILAAFTISLPSTKIIIDLFGCNGNGDESSKKVKEGNE